MKMTIKIIVPQNNQNDKKQSIKKGDVCMTQLSAVYLLDNNYRTIGTHNESGLARLEETAFWMRNWKEELVSLI